MTRKIAIHDLRSDTCRCGHPKGRGKSFCLSCFRRLGIAKQHALYKKIGNGYEKAYEAAVKVLFQQPVRSLEAKA